MSKNLKLLVAVMLIIAAMLIVIRNSKDETGIAIAFFAGIIMLFVLFAFGLAKLVERITKK